jgi:putative ABC transport system substrate-binding protein
MARQRQAKKKLGFLSSASANELKKPIAAFHRGLKQAGFVEGKNVAITSQWAKHDLARLPELAEKLVKAGVDVIAATGGIASAQAAVNAARNAPGGKQVRVVFVGGFDPVQADLVDNPRRPSGHATGVSTSTAESLPQRVQLLEKLVNGKNVVALLSKPDTVFGRREAQAAGHAPKHEARSKAELKARFADAKQRGHAVVVSADAFFTGSRDQIVGLAKQCKIPTAYAFREYVDAGGLMSYGPSLTNSYRQAGLYAGTLLGGGTCADLCILEPNRFELVINLRAAKALDIDVPVELLARADHVIG